MAAKNMFMVETKVFSYFFCESGELGSFGTRPITFIQELRCNRLAEIVKVVF